MGSAGPARCVRATRPGDLVCRDRFYTGKLKGVGRVWQLTACDAAASYGIAQVIRGAPRASHAAAFLTERVLPAYRRAGHGVRAVLTDGGMEVVQIPPAMMKDFQARTAPLLDAFLKRVPASEKPVKAFLAEVKRSA